PRPRLRQARHDGARRRPVAEVQRRLQGGVQGEERREGRDAPHPEASARPGRQLPRRRPRQRHPALQRRARLRDDGGDQAGGRVVPPAEDDAVGPEGRKGGVRMTALALALLLAAPSDNALTEQEKADGWLLLFDGQTLDGW